MDSLSVKSGKQKRQGLGKIDKLESGIKKSALSMHKRSSLDTTSLMRRAEDLISAASNRYRITVQVANRAKRRRYEDFENIDDPMMKPVLRAIIEMSDELTQPEIIGD